jgi:hypothetical protein
MGFIRLNRFGDPAGAVFDAAAVVKKIQGAFADTKVLAGDQLAISVERAAAASESARIWTCNSL